MAKFMVRPGLEDWVQWTGSNLSEMQETFPMFGTWSEENGILAADNGPHGITVGQWVSYGNSNGASDMGPAAMGMVEVDLTPPVHFVIAED